MYVRTWSEVHRAVNWQAIGYGGNEEVLSLNLVKVMAAGSALKKAGDRDPNKYITEGNRSTSARATPGIPS